MYNYSDSLLDQYDYADDPVLRKHLHAWDCVHIGAMMGYAASIGRFGPQMMAHQNRVSKDGARFLKFLGFSDRAARNFRAAMLFHDLGKTHNSFNPSTWLLDERPTEEEKKLRLQHARLGANMWESFCKKNPELIAHPHFKVRYAVTLCHHERTDGTGPERMMAASLSTFAQISCIIDAYDGDRIRRPHQPRRRTPREALRRLAGIDDPARKYAGAFSASLLGKYIQMKERDLGISVMVQT